MNDHTTDQNQDGVRGEAAVPGSPEAFSALMASIRALGKQDRERLREQADSAEVGFDAYALGQEYLERGEWGTAQRWLRIADRHGVPGAADDLDRALICELAELGDWRPEVGGKPRCFITRHCDPVDDGSGEKLSGGAQVEWRAPRVLLPVVRWSSVPAGEAGGQEHEQEEVSAVRNDAQLLAAGARDEAEQILADARREAEQIRADARRQATPLSGSGSALLHYLSARWMDHHTDAQITYKPWQVLLVVDDSASLEPASRQHVRRVLSTVRPTRKMPAAEAEGAMSLVMTRWLGFWEAGRMAPVAVSSRHAALERAVAHFLRRQLWDSCHVVVPRGSFAGATRLKAVGMDIDVLCRLPSRADGPSLWRQRFVALLDGLSETPDATGLWFPAHGSVIGHDQAVSGPLSTHCAPSVVPGGEPRFL